MMRRNILILLCCVSCLFAKTGPVFLFDREHADAIIVKEGAKLENGILRLDGKKGHAEFKESADFHYSESGMTLVCEARLNEGAKQGEKISRDMFLSKGHEMVFSREGTRLYGNFNDGKRWAAPFWGGSAPSPGEWTQFICVVERVNDFTQGEIGYRVSYYINGDLEARANFMNVSPKHVSAPIQIGCGFGGGTWLLNGDICKAAVYDHPLSEHEIAELMDHSVYVRRVENDVKPLEKSVQSRLDALSRAASSPQASFLLDAARLALLDGFDGQNVNLLPSQNLVTLNLPLETLFSRWRGEQGKDGLAMIASDAAALIVASPASRGTGFPVYGLFDRKAGRSVFGKKGLEWEIEAVKPGGKKVKFTSFNSAWRIAETAQDSLRIEWRPAEGITATSTVTLKGARLEADFKVDNQAREIRIEQVLFPKVRFRKLDGEDMLAYPSMSGILVRNPTKEQFSGGQEGQFPSGRVNMQFSLYYDEKSGIYFAFEDPLGRSKYYSVKGRRNDIVCTWEWTPGHSPSEAAGGNDFSTSGKFAVELYRGDWFDGGQIYKRFLSEKAAWWVKDLPRTSTPEWFRNVCIRILGVKCSQASSFAKTKEEVIRLRKYFDMPIAFHWYGWDDPAQGAWPHFRPKSFALPALAELKSKGIYVKPYIDARLWRLKDGSDGKTDWMYSSHGKKYAVKHAKGLPVTENHGALYAVQCPAAKGWQDYMLSLVERLAEYGFDAVYHDQVATARPYPCYDASHGHRLGGGDVWLENGYWPMYERIRALKSKYPNLAHDTEEAADPYLGIMDGYMVWRWTDPGQIPLFTSIYSGRIQFTGRLFNHQSPGDDESFFAKVAEQFVNSEQIGWFDYPDMKNPKKRLYVKKLGHLRHALLNYFNEADMQHPLSFNPPVPEMRSRWGAVGNSCMVTTPKVRHGVYLRKDGLKMAVFTNVAGEKVTISPALNLGGSCLAVCREGVAAPELTSQIPRITLEPHCSEVWIIGDREPVVKEAARISEVMRRISGFSPELP